MPYCLLALLSLLSFPGLVRVSPPSATETPIEFHIGDVSKLKARVVSAERITVRNPATLLWVEVTNLSEFTAEPLSFLLVGRQNGEMEASGRRVLARVDGVQYGRAGRVVLPGQTLRYPLVTNDAPKWVNRAKYTVQSASFSSGTSSETTGVADPLVTVRLSDANSANTERATLRITCGLEQPVDAIFRASFAGKNSGEGLLFARLEPSSDRDYEFTSVPFDCTGEDSLAGVVIQDVELVDWSVVVDSGAEKAAELLHECWSRRAHLDARELSFVSTCRVSLKHHVAVSGRHELVQFTDQTCRIGFDAAGRLVVVDRGDLPARAAEQVQKYARLAHCPSSLRHAPGHAPDRAGNLSLALGGVAPVILVAGDEPLFVLLQDDRIRGRRRGMKDTGLGETWTTSERDGGWVLDEVSICGLAVPSDGEPLESAPQFASQLTWSWSTSGPLLPTELSIQSGPVAAFPGLFRIRFEDWVRE